MSELPSIDGKTAIKAFESLGFAVVRISSSHHIMKREGHRFLLSVPVHGKQAIKPGTLRSLIKASGHSVEEFCAALSWVLRQNRI